MQLPALHRGKSRWSDLHVARSTSDRNRVFQHRFQVYTASRGPDYPGADHRNRVIIDPEDGDAILLYSSGKDGEINSSLRIYLPNPDDLKRAPQILSFLGEDCTRIRKGYVAQLGRMCSSAARGKDLLRLMLFGYHIGLCNGIDYAFLTARWEFRKLYDRLGYRLIGPCNSHLVPEQLFLFGASLTDYCGFIESGSPYAALMDAMHPRARLSALTKKNNLVGRR